MTGKTFIQLTQALPNSSNKHFCSSVENCKVSIINSCYKKDIGKGWGLILVSSSVKERTWAKQSVGRPFRPWPWNFQSVDLSTTPHQSGAGPWLPHGMSYSLWHHCQSSEGHWSTSNATPSVYIQEASVPQRGGTLVSELAIAWIQSQSL